MLDAVRGHVGDEPLGDRPTRGPNPDTAKTRSPTVSGGESVAHGSAGRFGRSSTSSAMSRPGSHVNTDTASDSSPLRTDTSGPGSAVAARTVVYEVSR